MVSIEFFSANKQHISARPGPSQHLGRDVL